jgi:hypothetical protein
MQERSSAWHMPSSDRRGDRGLEPRKAFTKGHFSQGPSCLCIIPRNHFVGANNMVSVWELSMEGVRGSLTCMFNRDLKSRG